MTRVEPEAAAEPGASLPDLPIPMLRVAPGGAVLSWNAALGDVVPRVEPGTSVQNLLGLALEDLALAAGVHPLPVLLKDDGSPRLLLCQVATEGDRGFLLVLTDLDAVRKAEERRFDNTPYGMVRLDRLGRVSYANAKAALLWKDMNFKSYEFGELFDEPFPGRIRRAIASVIATGTAQRIELTEGFEVRFGKRRI